jgi:hypothetical protein
VLCVATCELPFMKRFRLKAVANGLHWNCWKSIHWRRAQGDRSEKAIQARGANLRWALDGNRDQNDVRECHGNAPVKARSRDRCKETAH